MYEVVLGIDGNESRAIAQVDAVADLPAADSAVHATLLHDLHRQPDWCVGDAGGVDPPCARATRSGWR